MRNPDKAVALRRRSLLAAAGTLPAFPGMARAQGISSRPVTVVVPFSAGSGPDILARLFASYAQRRWNQPFVVENRTGASGNIGTASVARAAADGHTLLLTANTLVMNVSLFRTLPYDPVRDFTPLALLVDNTFALVANAGAVNAGAGRDLAAFIALAKTRPGAVDYGSPGYGTPHHLGMTLLERSAGIRLNHVPYRGLSGAVTDILGGQVSAMFLPVKSALELAADGRVTILGVAAANRVAIAPELRTLAEQGLPNVELDNWWGLLAPAGLPGELVRNYSRLVGDMLSDAEAAATLQQQGLSLLGGPPERFQDKIAQDLRRWADLVREAGIRPE